MDSELPKLPCLFKKKTTSGNSTFVADSRSAPIDLSGEEDELFDNNCKYDDEDIVAKTARPEGPNQKHGKMFQFTDDITMKKPSMEEFFSQFKDNMSHRTKSENSVNANVKLAPLNHASLLASGGGSSSAITPAIPPYPSQVTKKKESICEKLEIDALTKANIINQSNLDVPVNNRPKMFSLDPNTTTANAKILGSNQTPTSAIHSATTAVAPSTRNFKSSFEKSGILQKTKSPTYCFNFTNNNANGNDEVEMSSAHEKVARPSKYDGATPSNQMQLDTDKKTPSVFQWSFSSTASSNSSNISMNSLNSSSSSDNGKYHASSTGNLINLNNDRNNENQSYQKFLNAKKEENSRKAIENTEEKSSATAITSVHQSQLKNVQRSEEPVVDIESIEIGKESFSFLGKNHDILDFCAKVVSMIVLGEHKPIYRNHCLFFHDMLKNFHNNCPIDKRCILAACVFLSNAWVRKLKKKHMGEVFDMNNSNCVGYVFTAIMLASKFNEDFYMNNKLWMKV